MKAKTYIKIKSLSIAFLLSSLTVAGQIPIDTLTGKFVYEGVVVLSGQNKETIFKKAKSWIVTTLKSGDNMVALGGNNSDEITGTGNILIENISTTIPKFYYTMIEGNLNFKFSIFCKDGKYKYRVENFTYTYKNYGWPEQHTGFLEKFHNPFFNLETEKGKKANDESTQKLHADVNSQIPNLIASLEKFMMKKEIEW